MSSQYANFRPLTAKICCRVWGTPANFNRFRVLPSLLQRRRSLEANQTLHDVWSSPGLLHYIYIYIHFWGLLPPDRILLGAIFTLVQVLHSFISAALLHGTPAAGINQTLRHGTRNGITELSQRLPPIFGRAAFMLGIGPHSSYLYCIVAISNDHSSSKRNSFLTLISTHAFSALTLLVGRQAGHPARKKIWGMVEVDTA